MAEKKGKKAKWEFPIGIEPMSREDADAEMKRFFASIEEQYKDVPAEEVERGARKIKDFIDDKLNWAQLFDFTPEMLFQVAEFGFMQFKTGRYEDAERVFKVLTVLDWNNAYYHSVMGSILQRQKRYGEAIAEYSQAIELDPDDIVSYTNRGEVLLMHGILDEATADLDQAMRLDPDGEDEFANRARVLRKEIDKRTGKTKAGAKPKAKSKKADGK